MRTIYASLLFVSFGAAAAQVELPPPYLCPQCGEWEINRARPSGATGERISIGPESVNFPTCGRFLVTTAKQSMSVDPDRYRTYRITLNLQSVMSDSLCAVPSEEAVRMEIEVGVGYNKDGGIASFSIYKHNEENPIVTAEAWNFERDDPCDSGSGRGSAACMQISNAQAYKALANEVYDAHIAVTPKASSSLSRQFNVASFAASALKFCLNREAGNGGGSWPYVWALSCQSERLQSKLLEVRTWRTCVEKANSKCVAPTNKFDRSKIEEK